MLTSHNRRLGLAVILSLCATNLWAQQSKTGPRPAAIPPNVVIERDIQYGKAGDVPLLLDIVRPKDDSDAPRPVIAFIHGGGWRAGKKADALGQLMPFAAVGKYFCVSIEYRLSDVATWPAQIHDCKAAIRWLRANAAKYHLDAEKIGVWGSSAGGHLVSMLGVSGGVKELEGDCGSPGQSSRVTCVVDFCGPSDFLAIGRIKEGAGRGAVGPVAALLGGPIEARLDVAKAASPVTYVSRDSAPFLIMHGTADNLVPLAQAETLDAALKKAGAQSTFVKIGGGGHGFGGPEVTKRVIAFFQRHLRGAAIEISADPIPATAMPGKQPAAPAAVASPGRQAGPRTYPKGEWLDPIEDAPNGTTYKKFASKTLGRDVSYLVYLPPGYETGTRRYPVIYWLHGMGGNQRAGAMSFVPRVAAAIEHGALPPVIVVLVNGMVTSFYCDAVGDRPVESVIIKDLIPHVDRTYRTIAKREGRAVEGYSMGGYGAGHLGLKYPELFGTVAINAGAMLDPAPTADGGGPMQGVFGRDSARRVAEHPNTLARKNADQLRGKTHIRIGCGSLDGLLPRSVALHEMLDELKVEHEYIVVPGIAHDARAYYTKLGDDGFAFHRKAFAGLEK